MTQQHTGSQKPTPRAPTVLTAHQARTLLEVAQGNRLHALLVLALATGLSRGEVLALRWSDIDLVTQTLRIRRSVHWNGTTGYVEDEPKTQARRRSIPMPRMACDALKRHQQQQEQEWHHTAEQGRGNDLVFRTPEGAYLASTFLTGSMSRLLRQGGLPPLHFHDLRRSTASLLLTAGVHPFVVQKLLGLGAIRTPGEMLSPLPSALLVEAMKTMDRLLSRDEQDPENSEHALGKDEQE